MLWPSAHSLGEQPKPLKLRKFVQKKINRRFKVLKKNYTKSLAFRFKARLGFLKKNSPGSNTLPTCHNLSGNLLKNFMGYLWQSGGAAPTNYFSNNLDAVPTHLNFLFHKNKTLLNRNHRLGVLFRRESLVGPRNPLFSTWHTPTPTTSELDQTTTPPQRIRPCVLRRTVGVVKGLYAFSELHHSKLREWRSLTLLHFFLYPIKRKFYNYHRRFIKYSLHVTFAKLTPHVQFGSMFENHLLLGMSSLFSRQGHYHSLFVGLARGTSNPNIPHVLLKRLDASSPFLGTWAFSRAARNYFHKTTKLVSGIALLEGLPPRAPKTFTPILLSAQPHYVHYLLKEPLLLKWVLGGYNHNPLPLLGHNLSVLGVFGGGRTELSHFTNLTPAHVFRFWLRRRAVRLMLQLGRFSPNVTMWYYQTLIRFVEVSTGKRSYLKFNPFVENQLTVRDLALCTLWELRVQSFQKVLGPRIFLNESLRITFLAIKLRDARFLMNWIIAMLARLSFWKYKTIFRYLKYVVRVLMLPYFSELRVQGFKLKLKGKISVAGNARTRTLFYRVGKTSHATLTNKLNYSFDLIHTFTGVMGFHLWFFFIRT